MSNSSYYWIWEYRTRHRDIHCQVTTERLRTLDFWPQLLTLSDSRDNHARGSMAQRNNAHWWQHRYMFPHPMDTSGDVSIEAWANFHSLPHIYKHFYLMGSHVHAPIAITVGFHALQIFTSREQPLMCNHWTICKLPCLIDASQRRPCSRAHCTICK